MQSCLRFHIARNMENTTTLLYTARYSTQIALHTLNLCGKINFTLLNTLLEVKVSSGTFSVLWAIPILAPQTVLQRTPLEGSFERTLFKNPNVGFFERTLKGSSKS